MKNVVIRFMIVSLIAIASSCSDSFDYNVSSYMKPTESDSLLMDIIPYIAKLENGVNYDNRFDTVHKEYFKQQQQQYKFSFEQYFIASDSTHYFLIWKIAPSLYKKKIAIGGRFKKDATGKVIAFEELFNTWKMPEEELKEKSFPIFDYMVKNGNVDKYLSDRNTIEFPDDRCVYDKKNSKWVFKYQLENQNNPIKLLKDSVLAN